MGVLKQSISKFLDNDGKTIIDSIFSMLREEIKENYVDGMDKKQYIKDYISTIDVVFPQSDFFEKMTVAPDGRIAVIRRPGL